MKMLAPQDGPDITPVDSSGEWHGATFWMVICGAAALVLTTLAALACWIARRRNSLAHKLGSKRCPDKALVFQPPRRATAVRSPGSATHYLRKSPSPTAPVPPATTSPPQPQPPPQNPGSGNTSPHTPTAPSEPTPLSKELADANATEKTKPIEPENNDGKLGDLHFKLRYEIEKNALVVSVVSCQGLPGREPAGPDPYVKLQLLPEKQHKVKTRVVRKTRCPVYDEDFTFYGLPPYQLGAITLHFVVLSFDRYSRDEIIGEVVAPLSSLQLQSGEAMALCREIQPRSLKMRSVGRGEVLVSLCWQPAAARLTVVLLKARNLPKMDVTGLADPYVKMYLLYNGQRIAKKKTHVKKRTLNPVFNESFVFEVPAAPNATLDHVSLELLVLDWDRVTKNEVIGRLELGAEGAGGARHHWREVQAAPRRQIADWHKLKE
ncbi:synaptotagmin-4 isoform X2 [Achroia grisella]|uniref:synaptotagmin-4 isoform X2 n=1 Tax=Achroia grisella TaxID=688607 RepID=UPI0027D2E814|nr:synaptotagmin-4 isoform X2 [Achroia grisella]